MTRENPDARMPLLEHLRELRNRLVKAMLGLLVGMVIGWIVFHPVWQTLQAPYCELPEARKVTGACDLFFTGIFSAFFLKLKISFIVGAVISSPIWLYQVWAFIAPGLHKRERRWTYLFMGLAVPLFMAGAGLAYLVVEKGLQLFLGMADEGMTALITVDEYLGYMTTMLMVFGLGFELPLLVSVLNLAGVLPHATLKKSRRMIIFGIFVFAAVATPSADPMTMIALAAPILVLFAVAEFFAWLNDKRKAARPGLYDDLSDDEASSLEDVPFDVGQPEPLDR
ncbi:twin-arginine translocase subunit TatC [Actinocorallia lasiicapitis]